VALSKDERFMKAAIKQAEKAYALGEVPIGCIIVYEGREDSLEPSKWQKDSKINNIEKDTIIGRGYNRRTIDKDTLAHAELIAIKKASKKLGDWRLEDCTMYVTLEPCQMCAGALIQGRLKRVVIGCMNPKAGSVGSVINLLDIKGFNHQVEITKNVLEEECSRMLKKFFKNLRGIES
jgi:tRNA(adenine34) deaminase